MNKRQNKEQRKLEKWLPDSEVIVNDVYVTDSWRAKDGINHERVSVIEILNHGDVGGLIGSRYEGVTKKKIQDVLQNRVLKVPFLPLYFYWTKKITK